jgi:hypothetical protein
MFHGERQEQQRSRIPAIFVFALVLTKVSEKLQYKTELLKRLVGLRRQLVDEVQYQPQHSPLMRRLAVLRQVINGDTGPGPLESKKRVPAAQSTAGYRDSWRCSPA